MSVGTFFLNESQVTYEVPCVQRIDYMKYFPNTIPEALSLRNGHTNWMYHGLNNIKEEMGVCSMNGKGFEEADTVVHKYAKNNDIAEKKQHMEKQHYIADEFILGPHAGKMNMKYHPDAVNHKENMYDNDDDSDLDSSSDSPPPLTDSTASEDELECGK